MHLGRENGGDNLTKCGKIFRTYSLSRKTDAKMAENDKKYMLKLCKREKISIVDIPS